MSVLVVRGHLHELGWVTHRGRPSAEKIDSAIRAFTYLARELPSTWDELPGDLKRVLVDLAYAIVKPPQPPFLQGVVAKLYAVWLIFTNRAHSLLELYEASMEFADVVLSLHERESEELLAGLAQRLEELGKGERTALLSLEDFAARVLES